MATTEITKKMQTINWQKNLIKDKIPKLTQKKKKKNLIKDNRKRYYP